MTSRDIDRRDYDIGYGKPPRQGQFRKGQSGNPKGKAPGRKNLKREVLEELSMRVSVSEGGRQRQLSKQTIIIKRMVSDAAKGDAKARDQLLRLIGDIEHVQPNIETDPVGSAKDSEILARFKAELVGQIRKDSK